MHFGDGVDNVRVRAASADVAAHALAELIDRQKRLRDQVGKAQLKKQYKPLDEMSRWKIEKGQVLPSGLQLVFDGEPPGHYTLAVERSMTVQAFLSLVAQVHCESRAWEPTTTGFSNNQDSRPCRTIRPSS